jgi:ADP-L-glycero-D-manno-heptose 6-epimerase
MIVITGAAGFIGSVLARELNLKGREDLVLVDRLGSDEKWKNIRNLKYAEYIHADQFFEWGDQDFWSEVEVIYHMGACSSTTERDMDFLYENNVNYSQVLFQLAMEMDIPFIYASSAATYGDGESGYSDQSIEGLKPLNPYGYSKQAFDQWVLQQPEKPRHWYGLKFFNVYGPNEYHKGDMSSLVYKAFHQIHDTGKVKLFKSHRDDYEDGKQLRDFVYVKDVCRAMLEMQESKKGSGIYNMGTGQARSFYDLVAATFKAIDSEPIIEYIPMPESIRHQYQYYTQAEMGKFKSLCPDFKFHSLEEGVGDYVRTHLCQKDSFY